MQQEENNKEVIKILEIKNFQEHQNLESGLHPTASVFYHLVEIAERTFLIK